ncbi:hypothetical protein BGS_1060 [Beggiatoa sp. SS]|nr:hypothetical protein BGS_1060 [Beggiatoa sp. SS]
MVRGFKKVFLGLEEISSLFGKDLKSRMNLKLSGVVQGYPLEKLDNSPVVGAGGILEGESLKALIGVSSPGL